LHEKPNDYTLDLRPLVSGRPGRDAGRARKLRERADTLADQASEATETAIAELRQIGLTMRDIAALTGVSYQRVHQLTQSTAR